MEQRAFVLGDRFWTVTIDGSSVTTETGRIGKAGRRQTRDHGHLVDALEWVDEAVHNMVVAGFVETDALPSEEPAPKIEPAAAPLEATPVEAAPIAVAPVAAPIEEPAAAEPPTFEGTLVANLLDQGLLELEDGVDVEAFAFHMEAAVAALRIPRGREVSALFLAADEVYELFATDAQLVSLLRRAA